MLLSTSEGGSGRQRHRAIVLYIILVVVWGFVWPISKLALESCPPVLFAGLRVFLSGILLLPWVLKGLNKATLGINLLLALLNVFFFYGLQNLALAHLPAGLLSIVVYIQPVVTAVVARLWLREALSPLKALGVIVGFVGVGIISLGQLHGRLAAGGYVLLGLAAGFSWAFGTVIYKKYRPVSNPVQDVGIQLTVGGILLLGLGSAMERWAAIHWTFSFMGELLFIALLGTALAWVIWSALLQTGEATRVAAWTFLVPVLSTVLSVIWMGELLTLSLWLGGGGVILGLYLVNGASRSSSNVAGLLQKRDGNR